MANINNPIKVEIDPQNEGQSTILSIQLMLLTIADQDWAKNADPRIKAALEGIEQRINVYVAMVLNPYLQEPFDVTKKLFED